MGWVWTAILAVLTVALIYLVIQGTIAVVWVFGGGLGLILAVLLALGILTDGGFFGGLAALILIVILIDFLF